MTATATAPAQAARERPGRRPRPPARRSGAPAGPVVVAALASIAVGTRSMGLGEVWRALLDADLATEDAVIVRELRVPRTVLGLLVGIVAGHRRRADAGPHPQPARRPRPARRRRPAPRSPSSSPSPPSASARRPATSGSPSPAPWPAPSLVYVIGSVGPRRRDPGDPGAGRRRAVGPAVRAGARPAGRRLADARQLPVLGGRLAGRPRRGHRLAGRAVHRRRRRCSRWSTPRR